MLSGIVWELIREATSQATLQGAGVSSLRHGELVLTSPKLVCASRPDL